MMRVANMTSPRTGNPVANQFIITNGNKTLFQSYSSPIVEIDRDSMTITVYRDYNYSRTTAKYRGAFMDGQGFAEMADTKGFEKFLAVGKAECFGTFTIIKAF